MIVSIFVIDFLGQKILVFSGIGMMIGTTLLGTHFYLTRPSLCSSSANSTLLDLAEMLQDSTADAPCNTQYGPLAVTSIILFRLVFFVRMGTCRGHTGGRTGAPASTRDSERDCPAC